MGVRAVQRGPADPRGRRWARRVAGWALVLSAPAASWWLVGDQSTVPADADPDYFIRPPAIDPAVERAVGVGALVVLVAAVVILVGATRRHRLDTRWWGVLAPLLAAGVLTAVALRAMTAGVIGANIGAGLMIFFGGPLVAALLIWAALWSGYLVLQARRRPAIPDPPPAS